MHSPGRITAPRSARRPVALLLAALAAVLLVATPASAKRVICIDGAGDAFLNNAEGYYRANVFPGDLLSVGGGLTDCMGQLEDGDILYIVTHGGGNGGTFTWAGQQYTGFGNGAGLMPVPQGFNTRSRIDVQLVWCFSARDPDGPGPEKTFRQKMVDALGGPNSGNTAGGYLNAVVGRVTYSVRGGTRAQQDASVQCLKDDQTWLSSPPVNRPGAQATQATAAQTIANNCAGAGGAVTIVIPNRVGSAQQTGYWAPFEELQQGPEAPALAIASCACETCDDCGCPDAIGYPEDDATPAIRHTWGRLKQIYR